MTNLAHWTHDDIEALGGDFDGSLSSLCIMSLSFDFTRSALAVGGSGNSIAASIGGNSNLGGHSTHGSKENINTSQVTTALQAIQAQAHSHSGSRNQNNGTNGASNNNNNSSSSNNNNNNNNDNNSSTDDGTPITASTTTAANTTGERDTSSHHAQESMFGYEQASKQRFQYILAAPISAATKVTEDTMTYLNQGQAYEIKLKNITDISEGKKGFMCSIINIGFHERHMQQAENELWQQWSQQHPGERIFSVDMKLSYNVFGVESDGLNKYEFLWDSSKAAGVFIRINSISTEFTLRKHGGEKGIPFKLSIETFSYNSKTHDSYFISAACCQIKVFKPKGAERKIRSDKDKFLKRPPSEQDKYHRSSDHTMFSECPLSSLHPMVDGSLSYYRHSHGHFASKQIEQSTSGTPAAGHSISHHHSETNELDDSDARDNNDNGQDRSTGDAKDEQQEQLGHHSSNESETGSMENANQVDEYDSSPTRDNNRHSTSAARSHTDYSTSRLMSAHTSSYTHHQHHQHRSSSMENRDQQQANQCDADDQQEAQHHTASHNHSASSDQSTHLPHHHHASSSPSEQPFHHHQQVSSIYHHHQHQQTARSAAGLTATASHTQPFNHHAAYYNTHTTLPAFPSTHHHHHISSHIGAHPNPLHHLPSSFHAAPHPAATAAAVATNTVQMRAGGSNIATSSASYQRQVQNSLHQEKDSQKAFSFGSSLASANQIAATTPFRASNLAISSSSSNLSNNTAFQHQPHHHFSSIHSQNSSASYQQQQMADDMRADGASSATQMGSYDTNNQNFSDLQQNQTSLQAPSSCHRQRSASTSMTTNINPVNAHCSNYIGSAGVAGNPGHHHMTNGRNSESIGGYNSIGDHNHLMTSSSNTNPWMIMPHNFSNHSNNRAENSVHSSSACESRRCSANSNCTTSANGPLTHNTNGGGSGGSGNNNNNSETYSTGSGGGASSSSYNSHHNNHHPIPYEIPTHNQRSAHAPSDSPLSYCSRLRNISATNNQSYPHGSASSTASITNPNTDAYSDQPQQHEPPGRFNFCSNQYAVTVHSSCTEVASWLVANRFGLFLKTFTNFSGSDLLRLSKKELIEICGLLDGIRLYNSLHNQPIKPKRVLYVCNEGSEIFHSIYLYDVTLRELLREVSAIAANDYPRLIRTSDLEGGEQPQQPQHRKKSLLDRSSSSDSSSSIGGLSSGGETSGAEDNNSGTYVGSTEGNGSGDGQQDENNENEGNITDHNRYAHQDNILSATQSLTIYRLLVQGLTSVKVVATDKVVQMLDDESAWTLSLLLRQSGLHEACITACRTSQHSKRTNRP